jgi:hypothetical protein
MRWQALTAVVLAAALVVAACGDEGDTSDDVGGGATDADTASVEPERWMFTVTAGPGSMDGGQLTLEQVSDRVVGFADAPDRRVRTLTVDQLVGSWDDYGFEADPPNASVVVTRNGDDVAHVLTLADPALDGTELRFAVTELDPSDSPFPGVAPPSQASGAFDTATLFIDGAAVSADGTTKEGQLQVEGISESTYEDYKSQAVGAIGPSACQVSASGVEMCVLVQPTSAGDLDTWWAVAAAPAGQTPAQTAAGARVWKSPLDVPYVAEPPLVDTDSGWVLMEWTDPLPLEQVVPGEFESFAQLGPDLVVTTCRVDSDLRIDCWLGEQKWSGSSGDSS